MSTISIQEAQSRLVEIIHGLTPGDEVVITENDQPVARLVLTSNGTPTKPRQLGTMKGTVLSMEHFDDPLEEFEEYM
jgi:antitoxin (DNA-binding transcriptional repressor) of toxin-antitoxin stability system